MEIGYAAHSQIFHFIHFKCNFNHEKFTEFQPNKSVAMRTYQFLRSIYFDRQFISTNINEIPKKFVTNVWNWVVDVKERYEAYEKIHFDLNDE